MDERQINSEQIKNQKKVFMSADLGNEDDGFFSDVPNSGSRSKSLIALNKYVKKNLLYDEDEEYNEDSAYFSKESTPNYSISKCDSESLKSNESFDKKDSLPKNEFLGPTYDTSIAENESIVQEVVTSVEQTDDYKSMQLLEGSKEDVLTTESISYHENKLPLQPNSSASLTNLHVNPNCEKENGDSNVKLRENTKHRITNTYENRHTLHDFSEWVNRATIYPDVYAPLPYSEYCLPLKIFYHAPSYTAA